MASIFSSPDEMKRIGHILHLYSSLPFSGDTIPGAVMEAVLANVRGAEVLRTYDFVDVIDRKRGIGWQVKSTKLSTPVTWKRAKIPNADQLINESRLSSQGLQALGDAIIDFCNDHALESIHRYNLSEIGYARLVVFPTGKVTYFERVLCTKEDYRIFKKEDFVWKWSKEKATVKKEQLSALHGVHIKQNAKWWAWHGLGENQLHFSGEDAWWTPSGDEHSISFQFPSANERMSLEDFMGLLEKV